MRPWDFALLPKGCGELPLSSEPQKSGRNIAINPTSIATPGTTNSRKLKPSSSASSAFQFAGPPKIIRRLSGWSSNNRICWTDLTGPSVTGNRLVCFMTKILLLGESNSGTEDSELRLLLSLCPRSTGIGSAVGRCGKLLLFMTVTVRRRVMLPLRRVRVISTCHSRRVRGSFFRLIG
jgi:hypothetical protein